MRWEGTLALLTLGACLVGYAFFVDSHRADQINPEDTSVRLWDLSKDKKLSRLTVTDASGSVADFYRRPRQEGPEAWYYSKAASYSLVSYDWQHPLKDTLSLVADRKVEDDPKDLKGYGLDKPQLRIGLGEIGQPDSRTILIGNRAPLDQGTAYMQVANNKAVYMIATIKVENWEKLVVAPPVATPSPSPAATASAIPAP